MQDKNDLELKQTYLRQQIVDNGYSPEDFLSYMSTQKQFGQDISNWNLQELKLAVKKYKQQQNTMTDTQKTNQQQDNITQNEIQNKIDIFKLEQHNEQKEKVQYQKTTLFDYELERQANCKQFKGFLQDTSKIKLDVMEYKLVTKGGSFFGIGKTTQLWYTIKCSLLDSPIKRSDQDFIWLRTILLKMYPGHAIPPIIKIEDLQKQTSQSLQQRRNLINFFLKSLYEVQELFNTKLVISFLTWIDYNKFIQSKKQYNSILFKRSLKNIHSQQGLVSIEISTKNNKIIKHSQILISNLQNIYEKLNNQSSIINKQFLVLSESIKQFSNIFVEYQDAYSNFCDSSPSCRQNKILNTISTIASSLSDWYKSLEDKAICITQNLSSVLKYNRIQIETIKEIIERRNNWKNQYLKYKQTLNKKKEKVISDSSKWELAEPQKYLKQQKNVLMKIILPKQSNLEQKMKIWLAFLNKQTQSEVQRILNQNNSRLAMYWTNYGVQTLKSIQDENEIFKELSNGILLDERKYNLAYQ